jgi:hypothetical protein
MSVCILIATNRTPVAASNRFAFRINLTPYVDTNTACVELTPSELLALDSNSTLPLVGPSDLRVLQTIRRNSIPLREVARCFTGEVDLTLARDYITDNPRHAVMHKGAIIGRYEIRERMSQGEIEYLDSERFLKARGKRPDSAVWHHREARIVMQGITGVNERVRLKMTLLPPGAFCANSANYIRLSNPTTEAYLFLLGVMNSQLTNFFFKAFSTNSNVNGYEVDNLPIPAAEPAEREVVQRIVDWILALHDHSKEPDRVLAGRDALMSAYLERLLNGLMYELYFRGDLGEVRLFGLIRSDLPPGLKSTEDQRFLDGIRAYFETLHQSEHPVRAALDRLQTLDIVRTIEAQS